MEILADILEELGVIAFSQKDDLSFQLLGKNTEWFKGLLPVDIQDEFLKTGILRLESINQHFPFIDNFLIDAQESWNEPSHSVCRSGIWTEDNNLGEEIQLEAFAYYLQGQSILLIENDSGSFQKQHAIFQKARDMALLNEKLVSELNQRQRELQNEIEKRIKQSSSLMSVAESVKSHNTAVMICQPNGQVEVMNNALVDIYELAGKDLQKVSLLEQWVTEAEMHYPELKQVIEQGSYWEGEFESQGSEGDAHWIRLTIGPVKGENGLVTHYVCVANDISELKLVDGKLGDEEGYDVTTHLPNRRHFWRHMQMLTEKNEKHSGLGLLYIDLDYFKRVNDDLGHEAGDFLLTAIASRISRNVKHNDFVAHLGGDEFAVLISNIENKQRLELIAERLLESIQESILVDQQAINMSASIGLALYDSEESLDPAKLVKQADLAMYCCKRVR